LLAQTNYVKSYLKPALKRHGLSPLATGENKFGFLAILEGFMDKYCNRPASATHQIIPADDGKTRPALQWMIETR
jgi:hypothetical protein